MSNDTTQSSFLRLNKTQQYRVIELSAAYSKTNSLNLNEENEITYNYDGTVEDLKKIIFNKASLRSTGYHIMIDVIFDHLVTNFDEFALSLVDYILIQRIGIQIVKIKNNNDKWKSHSLSIELNDVRRKAASVNNVERHPNTNFLIFGLIGFIAVQIGIFYFARN